MKLMIKEQFPQLVLTMTVREWSEILNEWSGQFGETKTTWVERFVDPAVIHFFRDVGAVVKENTVLISYYGLWSDAWKVVSDGTALNVGSVFDKQIEFTISAESTCEKMAEILRYWTTKKQIAPSAIGGKVTANDLAKRMEYALLDYRVQSATTLDTER